MKATRLCSIMLGLLLTTAVQASVEINNTWQSCDCSK